MITNTTMSSTSTGTTVGSTSGSSSTSTLADLEIQVPSHHQVMSSKSAAASGAIALQQVRVQRNVRLFGIKTSSLMRSPIVKSERVCGIINSS